MISTAGGKPDFCCCFIAENKENVGEHGKPQNVTQYMNLKISVYYYNHIKYTILYIFGYKNRDMSIAYFHNYRWSNV